MTGTKIDKPAIANLDGLSAGFVKVGENGAVTTEQISGGFAPLFFYPEVGNYYTMPTTGASITSETKLLVAGTIYLIPFPVGRNLTINRISIHVTTASGAGTKARLGIYSSTATGLPGDLYDDLGEVGTDGTGHKYIDLSPAVSLTANTLYWLAVIAESTPTIRGIATTATVCPFGGEPDGAPGTDTRKPSCSIGATYGALPDPIGAVEFSGQASAIWVRIAS